MNNDYQRLGLLIGPEQLENIRHKKVAIIGIGGVGTFTCESLARCGIENLHLYDRDCVDQTNINRQLIALHSTIGKLKVEVMKERIEDINPLAKVTIYPFFIMEDNIEEYIKDYDFVIDSCDTITSKYAIIKHCLINKIPFVSSMGAANKFDNTLVEVSDLMDTYNDPLAKVLRINARKDKLRGKIPVVFSPELPCKPHVDQEEVDKVKNRKTLPLLGSTPFVPPTFGLTCASYCFQRLLEQCELDK